MGRKAVAAKKGRPARKHEILVPFVLGIALLIFILAFAVRANGIIDAGVTWDEPVYVKTAIAYADLIPKESVFSSSIWENNFEHPPVAKFIYAIAIDVFQGPYYGLDAFRIAKYASAFMGALACVLTFLIGLVVYDRRTGILAGVILALLPVAVAHGQIAGLESPLMLFFTLAIFLFILGLKRDDRRLCVAAAVATGLTIDTKLNGLLIIPVLALLYACYLYSGKKSADLKSLLRPVTGFAAIVAATVVLLWPWLWTDFGTIARDPLNHLTMTLSHWSYVPQEYFLGMYQSAPIYYLPVYFLVTTPLLILGLGMVGGYFSAKGRDFMKIGIILWLLIPFAYGLFSFVQDGVRYIIIIFPALALVAAYGLSSIVSVVKQRWPKIGDEGTAFAVVGGLLSVYLIISLVLVSPYYLDYYNVLSGGQGNAQEGRLLEIGWWGEGIKQCVEYVEKNGAPGSTVLMATMPSDPDHFGFFADKMAYVTFKADSIMTYDFGTGEQLKLDNTAENQTFAWNASYIIVNSHYLLYNDGRVDLQKYSPVFSTQVDGATLCTVFQKKVTG